MSTEQCGSNSLAEGHHDPPLVESPDSRFDRLIGIGDQFEATSRDVNIDEKPSYFSIERFKRAQATCQKYYTNLSMASSTGLILLVQVESILIPLIKTGKSRTVPDLYDRYMATAKYTKTFYESDFHEPTSEGQKYIKIVRGMHQRIHKLMNEDPASPKLEPPRVWVNQYDMAITQFAFVGLFLLNQEKCAAYHVTQQELSDICYYWRLLSYYFGIEERFNIFVYHDEWDKQLKLTNLIFDHLNGVLNSKPRPRVGLLMAEGFMLAFEDFVTESSFNILDHWWSPFVSLSGKSELSALTLGDRWKSMFFHLYFKILFRSDTLLSLMNSAYKKKFDKFCADGDKIKEKLAKKYSGHVCV